MFDLVTLIKTVGYLGLFGIVFAESGLFIGFFLPGDSLLFTAGFLASQGFLDIVILTPLIFVAAILGDNFGYAFGKKVGPAIFTREDSLLFHKDHMERARIFYEQYGPKTIVLARFLPIIRTFAPILAGVGNMRYPVFFFYNVIGAVFWAIGVTFAGYFLGSAVPGVDRYLLPITILIIVVSFLPPVIHILKNKEERARFAAFFENLRQRRIHMRLLKITVGVLLVVLGFFATITPMTPGSWLAFIGFELLGIRFLLRKRLRRFWDGVRGRRNLNIRKFPHEEESKRDKDHD